MGGVLTILAMLALFVFAVGYGLTRLDGLRDRREGHSEQARRRAAQKNASP